MDQAFAMRGRHALGHFPADVQRLCHRQNGLALEPVVERFALEKFHGQEGNAAILVDVVDGDDVVVLDPTGARPLPILRFRHQLSPYWIAVNVFDHSQNDGWISRVVVEAATGLPETAFETPAMLHCNARQPLRRVLAQVLDRLAADRFLDGLENLCDIVFGPNLGAPSDARVRA
jgi:hypothetical protein